MQNKEIVEAISKFTKINENKIKDYLKDNSLLTLFEHPETINPTVNQLRNFKDLQELRKVATKLINYKEYKFEDTLDSIPFLEAEFKSRFDKEHFIIAYLDNENKLLGSDTISTGTINASIVHPRDVMKQAIQYNSDRLILAHNHPSGNPTPSDEDRNITRRLEEVADLLDRKIIDHIIIGRDDYYSFREQGDISVDYQIEKTNNTLHEKVYKKDLEKNINLINKFTKIPKTKLKEIFKDVTLKDFIKNPAIHIKDPEQIEKINKLNNLKNIYHDEVYSHKLNNFKIQSPENIQDYVMTRYDNYDNINIVMFLDTKNTIIESEILPNNLSKHEEAKHIMEKSILHDSNSIVLSTKNNNKYIKYDQDNIDRIYNIKNASEKVGIKLLDNLEISNNNNSRSYLQDKILEGKQQYKIKPKERKKLSESKEKSINLPEKILENKNQNLTKSMKDKKISRTR